MHLPDSDFLSEVPIIDEYDFGLLLSCEEVLSDRMNESRKFRNDDREGDFIAVRAAAPELDVDATVTASSSTVPSFRTNNCPIFSLMKKPRVVLLALGSVR